MIPMNIAHMGFSAKYPENTILSFQKALEAGADGIGIDVRMSRDGELVILHDQELARTTNAAGPVDSYTLYELLGMDASGEYEGVFEINRIPTLEDYFHLIQGKKVFTWIELRIETFWYPEIEEKVIEVVDWFKRRQDVVVCSFDHQSVAKVKELAPDIACGFLVQSRMIGAAEYCRRLGIENWHPCCRGVTKALVDELHGAGVKVNAWGADTREEMEEMVRLGVDAVLTNDPQLFDEVRCKAAGKPGSPKLGL